MKPSAGSSRWTLTAMGPPTCRPMVCEECLERRERLVPSLLSPSTGSLVSREDLDERGWEWGRKENKRKASQWMDMQIFHHLKRRCEWGLDLAGRDDLCDDEAHSPLLVWQSREWREWRDWLDWDYRCWLSWLARLAWLAILIPPDKQWPGAIKL